MRIQHNLSAMNSLSQYHGNNSALSNNLEKLSSGYKINTAADDAAGLAISEKMRSQIAGLEKAQDNANDGISLVQTAEGALKEVNSMLTRLKTLATQSANGTYENGVDRANIQEEADALLSEIDRISESTNFNGINLLDGSLDGKSQVSNVALDDTNAVAGKYKQASALAATGNLSALTKEDIGKTIDFSVTWKNAAGEEKTTTVSLTYQGQGDGTSADMSGSNLATGAPKNYFTDDTGKKYNLGTDGALTNTNIQDAFKAGLKADEEFSSAFKVDFASSSDKSLTFEANEKGSAGAVVLSTSVKNNTAVADGNVTQINGAGNVTVSSVAQNAMQRMSVTDITFVDGTATAASISAATFEIDGSKFLAVDKATFTEDKIKELDPDITVISLDSTGAADTTNHKVAATSAKDIAAIIQKQTGRATEGFNTITAGSGANAGEKYDNTLTGIKAGDIIFEDNTNRLKTSGKELSLQVGDTNADFQKVSVKIQDMSANGLGLKGLDLSNQEGAGAAIDTIKNAVDKVSMQRGQLGALQNRLDHTLNNLDATEQNISAAESQIRDTDMAKEMTQYSKNNILAQAAQSMLAQANSMPQGVLSLLG